MMNTLLRRIILTLESRNIAVIGEAILDIYRFGESKRLCREAPVPIVDDQNKNYQMPGGAANTSLNIAGLENDVRFLSVAGQDVESQILTEKLKARNVNTDNLVYKKGRKTLSKDRIICDGQLLLRYDQGSTNLIDHNTEKKIIKALKEMAPTLDYLVISDYNYGIITPAIIESVKKLKNKHRFGIAVDAKNLLRYKSLGISAAKPNYEEAIHLLKLPRKTGEERIEQIIRYGRLLPSMINSEVVVVTLDVDGSVIFQNGSQPFRTYASAVPNSKAAGAGDTYMAALTTALANGIEVEISAEIAQIASSIVVRQNTTSTCTRRDILSYLVPKRKIVNSVNEIMRYIKGYRDRNMPIVFTNGCFDILHSGHVKMLRTAKKQGRILIVGVNTDESIKRIKGSERPINSLKDRLDVLSALKSVDHLIAFEENTPEKLVKTIKPDIYVKGGDYTKEDLPEAGIVESYGGKVVIVPYQNNRSTSGIIKKIREGYKVKQGVLTATPNT